jgi:hypothetical protein
MTIPSLKKTSVVSMAAVGMSIESIAKRMNCTVKELEEQCESELRRAIPELRAKVGASLFQAAQNGNVAAMIFWLKTRAGWRQRFSADDDAEGGTASPPPAQCYAQVYLSCNGRCTRGCHAPADPHERREQYEWALGYKLPVLQDDQYPKEWTAEARKAAIKKSMAIVAAKRPDLPDWSKG